MRIIKIVIISIKNTKYSIPMYHEFMNNPKID